ncbi:MULTISPECIES: YidC family membrane integrase SpoIIIJ [Niallia]|uniref:Membrane protein insertase YidC n=2 Tax=Niallia TaxID=2837506 RepID=A0A3S3SJJ2_9BACI|nr:MULTISPECIES: YidC family membrane integrase SpoIIIJ [Niallia]MCM3217336.1 YidC family membrane integrase SpoIIIJ [Niallia taxi]MCT2345894.1 YidC family membrane integrase SpoIIIJ [Niallia taxi]MDE5053568.1 YidC family membrane integrase SpoIIIJ [Niallia taxi]MDK8642695.1 YidC family membrane integrase SpoIIIJ [Niallia taxi]MED3964406.1 YidC family membrane integrase SpoIIIJ [Niallia taxi]
MKKKLGLLFGLLFLMAILTGCTEFNQPITSDSEGFWNEYIVYPLSMLIIKTAEIAGGNFGVSIIIVTILVRLVILPLMIKQTKNSKAMQAVQPEMEALRKKYSSKDQKTQQKLQEETMKLFQENKVNPLAGCFPLIVQMPILIGFYHAISRTREIAQHEFLWFNLGQPDPFYLLPIIAGITTFIQTKMTMAGTAGQNPQMVMMQYIMPIMILVFAINFPAALSLYWVVGNIFTIIQTYFIKGPELKKPGQTGKLEGAKK